MKTKRTVIAACIATLFISGTVFAKDNWEYHESGWNNVNSYGKVAIAQDSVSQWGPWEDFVEPAAGAPSPVAMPGMSGGDQYRNNPIVVRLPEGCATGNWCGYAIFRNSASGGEETMTRYYYKPSDPWSAGLFALTPTPDDPSITAGSGRGEGTVFWRVTPLGTTDPTFSDSGTNIPANFGGGYGWYRDDGLHHFHAYAGNETDSGWESSSATGFSHNWLSSEASSEVGYGWFALAVKGADKEVAVGTFEREVATYTSGNEEYRYWDETTARTNGYYVAGIATPQAYLADQQARDIRAYYAGGSFDGFSQGKVLIQVQFAPGTWQGQWTGAMNFKAEGNISGANINSNSVSALYSGSSSSYAGSVQGTFYGQQAGSIGGVSSVTKTYTPPVDARIAQMPSTQTQTAVFLVNKVYSTGSSATPE
ncbi:hypothetical protein [Dechloromonas sp.]|uniref:hypothetical protein n=1 Tax=Dechloromonas sp. TaxID=1917218 RepID=UPI00286E7CBB|nr:hypothetical protein [Dechloromonas sp.]